jgi:hypothetical protein
MLDTDPVTGPDLASTERPGDRRPWRPVLAVVAGVVATVLLIVVLLAFDGGSQPAERGASPAREEGAELDPALTWAPPELSDPETVQITEDEHDLQLDPDTDYVVELPDEPLDVVNGVRINGGRNVVLIGGEIRISKPGDEARLIRGLYLRKQTGTIHVEGLLITGPELGEGINLDQREGATVQLQNIRVETVHGEREGHHADVLQTWAGPSVLRIDRLTGYTTYQGFFLLPLQNGDQDEPEVFDLRNVNIVGQEDAGYLLWRDGEDWPLAVDNVWVTPAGDRDEDDRPLWDDGAEGAATWDDVQVGEPPRGDFVPEGSVGVGYESPGYQQSGDGGD